MGLADLMKGATASQPTAPRVGTYQLNKIKLDVSTAAKRIAAKEGQRDLLILQRDQAEVRKKAAEEQLEVLDKVQILLQKTSEYARKQIKGHIEEIVSSALNIVYGGSHKFILELETRANRPEVDYYLDDGTTLTKLQKPDYDRGGGKINIITLALRLGIDELVGDTAPLLLDEIGANVDGEAAVSLAYFLKEYSVSRGRQIVLITHNEALADIADVGLRVSKKNGEAIVKGVTV